jgi:hypothetical protein
VIFTVSAQSAGQFSGSGGVFAGGAAVANLTISGTVTASGGISGSFILQSIPPGVTIVGALNGVFAGNSLSGTVTTQTVAGDTCVGSGTFVLTRL